MEKQFRNDAERIIKSLNKYEPMRLHFWLLHDTWTVDEALVLLCGFDPKDTDVTSFGESVNHHHFGDAKSDKAIRLDGICMTDDVFYAVAGRSAAWSQLHHLRMKHLQMKKVWGSGNHNGERFSPSYFVSWANNKHVHIDWLEWANGAGYADIVNTPEEKSKALIALNEKPLSTTERNTLLTIIAALCDALDIDPQKRGFSGDVAKMTERIGAAVTDDTIRKILNKIPAALEARTK